MPENAGGLINALNQIPKEVAGVLMAMFVAILRVIYDKDETRPMRIVLESLICGALSLTASSAIMAMGLNINWSLFAGGTIGYFGSATVRNIALSLINKRID